jgi:hypothetical protein
MIVAQLAHAPTSPPARIGAVGVGKDIRQLEGPTLV